MYVCMYVNRYEHVCLWVCVYIHIIVKISYVKYHMWNIRCEVSDVKYQMRNIKSEISLKLCKHILVCCTGCCLTVQGVFSRLCLFLNMLKILAGMQFGLQKTFWGRKSALDTSASCDPWKYLIKSSESFLGRPLSYLHRPSIVYVASNETIARDDKRPPWKYAMPPLRISRCHLWKTCNGIPWTCLRLPWENRCFCYVRLSACVRVFVCTGVFVFVSVFASVCVCAHAWDERNKEIIFLLFYLLNLSIFGVADDTLEDKLHDAITYIYLCVYIYT